MFTWLSKASESKSVSFDSLHRDTLEKYVKDLADFDKFFADTIPQRDNYIAPKKTSVTVIDNTEGTSRIVKSKGGMAWMSGGEPVVVRPVEFKSKFDETTGSSCLKETRHGVTWVIPEVDPDTELFSGLETMFADKSDVMQVETAQEVKREEKYVKVTEEEKTIKSIMSKKTEKLSELVTTEKLIQEFYTKTKTAKMGIKALMIGTTSLASMDVQEIKVLASIQAEKVISSLKKLLDQVKLVQVAKEGSDLKMLQATMVKELAWLGQVKAGICSFVEKDSTQLVLTVKGLGSR